MIVAPNDAGVPDPGRDGYAGSVEEQLKDQAVRRVRDEHRGDAGWHHDPDHQLDEDAARKEAQRQAEEFTAGQHDRLAHGVAMRGGPQVGGMNYLGIPHEKLHEMVNNDIDPGTVDQAGAAWNAVGAAMRGIGDRLTKASASTEQAWSGAAAEGARGFNSGVAGWSDTTAQGALLSSNNMATQSDAAGTAKSTVPPPMKYSLWDEVTDLLSAPDPVSGANTVRAKLRQQQELHRQAADAVAAYDQTLSHSSSTMPAFETPPAFDPNAHDPTGPPAGGGNEPPPGRLRQVVPLGGSPSTGGNRPLPGGSPPPGGPDGGPRPGDPSPVPDDPHVTRPGSTGTDPSWADPGSPPHVGSAGADGLGGLGSGGGRGPGQPGFGSLGGAPVGGEEGGPGGAGGGFGEPRGSGGARVPGSGAGALAAEQAALGRGASGAAGARGAAGMGGMPIGAGGSGPGSADEEHERPSYLLEEDPNALFATDEATSPSVIE